jgi:hypothetical protein
VFVILQRVLVESHAGASASEVLTIRHMCGD